MPDGRDGKIVTFYSYKGGTGRTMALANTAWILASNGLRVLVVDWDLESPGLHRFYKPFLDPAAVGSSSGVIDMIKAFQWETTRNKVRPLGWLRDFARVQKHAISLDWDFAGDGTLDFLSAGRQNRDYSAAVASLDWDNFYDRLGGGQFFDAMRADMKANYDYTLIDSRTGISDVADICTVHFPDTLVTCFTLSDQGIDGAAAVARDIATRYAERGIRILPVPTRIDEGEKEKADAGRGLARAKFGALPSGFTDAMLTEYWGNVEIPYRPFYAYEETLSTFGDVPGVANSLLSAFERLTGYVTEGAVDSCPAIPDADRQRVLAAFTRRRPPQPADIVLSYVPEDRVWAEWIAAVLGNIGVRAVPYDATTTLNPDAKTLTRNRTVVLLSRAYLRSHAAMAFAYGVADTDRTGTLRQLITVSVADVRSGEPFTSRPSVDLSNLNQAEAIDALVRVLELPPPTGAADPTRPTPRFPGTVPQIWQVPQRNPNFTGRSTALEKLRDQLASGTVSVVLPVALHGLGGVGKTQVALEYAHRFKADYDLVWWINAEQPEMVIESLSQLAERLGLQVGESRTDAADDALQVLRRSGPERRWLLIFDNADDPQRLDRYLPAGLGHTVVTSRNQAWTSKATPLEVNVFERGESMELLTRRVPALAVADADRVAEALGDLPLAIEVAAAWLAETGISVEEYVGRLETESAQVLSLSKAPDYPHTIEATWNVSLERLRERSPAAERMLQLCAFMAPEISLNLIYSDDMVDALIAFDDSLREKLVLGQVIQEIGRLALIKVDRPANSIQIHRLVQAVIRNQIPPGEQREETLHEVHRILAGARPRQGGTDNPQNWPRYDLIWPHLEPSEAIRCVEEPVRQLLIERVRYLWKSGNFEAALTTARPLEQSWDKSVELGTEPATDQARRSTLHRQLLNLRFQIGNVLRSQGNYTLARELNEAVLADQRAVLRPNHPNTLMTARSLAADLRALSLYSDALEMDKATYESFKDVMGEDHPETLASANNLALSYRLVGDCFTAREIDEQTLERRREVIGTKHPYTLISAEQLARDLREMGEYQQSVALLRVTLAAFREVLGDNFPETLRTTKSLAVSLRRAGEVAEARRLTEETVARYEESEFESDNLEALACRLNQAADLSVADDKQRAVEITREVLVICERGLAPDHLTTLMCLTNLSMYERGVGRLEDAADLAQRAYDRFVAIVGPQHPYTLSAAINLANALADLGRPAESEQLEQAVLGALNDRFGPHHPDTLIAESNLTISLQALGRPDEAERRRRVVTAAITEKLGPDHANTVSVRNGQRVNRDLEPQPI